MADRDDPILRPRRNAHHKRMQALRAAMAGCCFLCLVVSVSLLIVRGMEARRTAEINALNRQVMAADEAISARAVSAFASADAEAQPLAEPIVADVPSTSSEPSYAAHQLLERNADYVGWLNVGCVAEIDFAVTQRDNLYYLDHDFTGRENSSGTAFVDELCTLSPRDDNLTIYAHNMRDGTMFGKLNRMTSLSRIKEAPFTTFSTINGQDVYVPIAVMHCSIDPYAQNYFVFSVNRFPTQAAFDEFVTRAKALSLISLPFDARYGDKLLTLATCIKNEDNMRFVVLLRALRPTETQEEIMAQWQ